MVCDNITLVIMLLDSISAGCGYIYGLIHDLESNDGQHGPKALLKVAFMCRY